MLAPLAAGLVLQGRPFRAWLGQNARQNGCHPCRQQCGVCHRCDLPRVLCCSQAEIRASRAAAFDLTAACSGFVMGLVTGAQYIRAGTYKTVLVIGACAAADAFRAHAPAAASARRLPGRAVPAVAALALPPSISLTKPGMPAACCAGAGADALSRYIDWRDRSTCILFGDACGAVVMTAKDDGSCALLGIDMHSGWFCGGCRGLPVWGWLDRIPCPQNNA